MKKHIELYYDFFGIDYHERLFSELSFTIATDIHHINCKGMGGSKQKDIIENLIALNREEHLKYGDKKQYFEFLIEKHKAFIKKIKPNYNFNETLLNQIANGKIIK